MGMNTWISLLLVSLMKGANTGRDDQPFAEFYTCNDHWDVRFPYLVEVRYTIRPFDANGNPTKNFHKNRQGALISHRAVLTRGHDLDRYPDTENGEMVPNDVYECRQSTTTPCLYVSTRRPTSNHKDPNLCGQSIIVDKVVFHPKFYRTASNADVEDLEGILQNMKFPFAVLVLRETVATSKRQTVFPALILPRDSLDLMYLTRRAVSMGHDSNLCEYPHYGTPKHFMHYTPYGEDVKVNMLDCSRDGRKDEDYEKFFYHKDEERPNDNLRKKNRTLCYLKTLCPASTAHDVGTSWEGVHAITRFLQLGKNHVYKEICEREMWAPHVIANSFMIFFSNNYTFVKSGSDDPKGLVREDTDHKLGSPIVCNGVGIAMTASWLGRGEQRRDAYVGTTFLRAWLWILQQKKKFQDASWHRATDDSPFLGEKYTFRKKTFPKRDYENRSVFDMSLTEEITKYGHGSQVYGSLKAPLFIIYLLTSY